MSYYTTYELDEFQPWPGLAVYVYGNAEISYNWQGRDRDTGEWPGPCDIEVEEITIYAHTNGRNNEPLAHDDPLYRAIENRLLASDSVVAACIEDHDQ